MYCDPEEVLQHLNLLGYKNVSEKQLTEFIRDLKKLIKYEQRKKIFKDKSHAIHNVAKLGDTPYSSCCSESSFSQYTVIKAVPSSKTEENCISEESSTSSEMSTSSSSDITDFPKNPKSRVEHNLKFGSRGFTVQHAGRVADSKRSHSSFIRSWRLNQTSNGLKNDPVARYQWYQTQWNKQKVPGEEPHNQLRWLVREKMLGDDPHPRPMSRTSGRSSRNS